VTVRAEDGERVVTVDEGYLTRAIQDPMKEVVKGYPASMPHLPLSDGELQDVIAYIQTLD
jgi:cytochrome c oxidase subunit 2